MNLGWIWTSNLRSFMTELAPIGGYRFDDSDWAAIDHGVRGTDPEVGMWFDYPLGRLTAKVGLENGHVLVEVNGEQNEDCCRLTCITDLMRNWYLSDRPPD